MPRSSHDGLEKITPISSQQKYHLKDFRRKIIKLCHRKLRIMDDPDSILCRAVLINNTLKYCENNRQNDKENLVTMDKTEISDFTEYGEEDKNIARRKENNETVDNNVKIVSGLSMPVIVSDNNNGFK